jgi:hypothetical protein
MNRYAITTSSDLNLTVKVLLIRDLSHIVHRQIARSMARILGIEGVSLIKSEPFIHGSTYRNIPNRIVTQDLIMVVPARSNGPERVIFTQRDHSGGAESLLPASSPTPELRFPPRKTLKRRGPAREPEGKTYHRLKTAWRPGHSAQRHRGGGNTP